MKNIFNKLGLLLMTLVMGVSYANADEVNNPVTLTVDPVSTMPGNIIDVPIMYESTEEQNTFQMDIVLPKGLTFELTDGKYGTVGDAIPQGCLYEEKFKDNREDGLDAVRVVCVSMVTPFKKGQLLTFKVKATDELADVTQIKLEKIKFSKIYFTYTIDVKNIKKEWDANEAANTKINEALMTTMTALDAADAAINETCLESLREGYLDKLADCATVINQKGMELSAKYAAIELTEKDVEDFVAVCAETQTKIQAILDEAAAMTKKFETNEAANATFQAAFTEISTLLNDADAKINDECPDVKDTYLDQLAEIATQVNQKGMELGSLYAAIELTQEVADKAAAEINAFAAQIKDIVAAAVKAQNEIATGIHGINADFQNAEAVYSIGGVRLNKAAKGVNVVIRNGKAIKVVK